MIFTLGCNFRCAFCHNPELVDHSRYPDLISADEVIASLRERVGRTEGVVVRGGEPTIHTDLPDFLAKIGKMGFPIKIDTNGGNPDALAGLLRVNLVDYIAMDVKAPLASYPAVIGSDVDIEYIRRSISLIMRSGIDYEFRTTVVKSQLSIEDLLAIGHMIKGARKYVLQRFVPGKLLNSVLSHEQSYGEDEFEEIKKSLTEFCTECVVR